MLRLGLRRVGTSSATSTPPLSTSIASFSTQPSALDKWSSELTGVQQDKLIEQLLKRGKLSKANTKEENRALQQESLRQLAGQSLLRDNATGWSMDAESGGHFFMNGSTPITHGWAGIEDEEPGLVRFPGLDDDITYEDSDGEEVEDEGYLNLLFVDHHAKWKENKQLDKQEEERSPAKGEEGEEPEELFVSSHRDEKVFGPWKDTIDTESLMALPDVYQSPDALSMWAFLERAKNITKSTESYTDVIAALFHHGDWRRARDLFDDMVSPSVKCISFPLFSSFPPVDYWTVCC